MTDEGFIVVSDAGDYFCGCNIFDKQLRKAKIYHSERYANQAVNDNSCKYKKLHIEKVVIMTVDERMKTNK